MLDSELIPSNYVAYRRDRNRHGRGVMILLRNSNLARRRQDLETDCEIVWVKCFLPKTRMVLGAFYRPPNSGECDLQHLHNSIEGIPTNTSSLIVLGGDFNLPNIAWKDNLPTGHSKEAVVMKVLQQEHNLYKLVHTPTRKENIIDLVLTNQPTMVADLELVDSLPGCNHDAISFVVDTAKPRVHIHKRQLYNFKRGNFDQYRELLDVIPWDCCFLTDKVEEAWTNVKDMIFLIADKCIPKTTMCSRKKMSWLLESTLKLIRVKHRMYKVAKRTMTKKDWNKYKSVRNKLRDCTRRDHQSHLQDICDNICIQTREAFGGG